MTQTSDPDLSKTSVGASPMRRARIVLDLDVGSDPDVLHLPRTVRTVKTPAGCGDRAPVDQRGVASNAHETSPRLIPDEEAEKLQTVGDVIKYVEDQQK